MTHEVLNRLFLRAARSALVSWLGEYAGRDEALAHDLWLWYLERPSVREKLAYADAALAQSLVREHALKLLKEAAVQGDRNEGRWIYSANSVKDALLGRSTNRYLQDILPVALEELDSRNEEQAEAIRIRYEDGVVPPKGGGAAMLLSRAVRSLTEIVNIIAIRAGVTDGNAGEGAASIHAVRPETRKVKDDTHSDPTYDLAIGLVEGFVVDKKPVDADQPLVLCALEFRDTKRGRLPQPILGPDGKSYLDSAETTTMRKELLAS